MRIKHKDSEKNNDSYTSLSLTTWHKNYFPNNKYLNYEFYNVDEIFDLYEINKKTGDLIYKFSDFSFVVDVWIKEFPEKYVKKPHDSKYLDEHLMPTKLALKISPIIRDRFGLDNNQSFFKRLKKPFKRKAKDIPSKKADKRSFFENPWVMGVSLAILAAILNAEKIKMWIDSMFEYLFD